MPQPVNGSGATLHSAWFALSQDFQNIYFNKGGSGSGSGGGMIPWNLNIRVKLTLPPGDSRCLAGETPSKTELGGPPDEYLTL